VKAVSVNVLYDCHLSEVMGYPERNYCFRRSNDALLMWEGYFNDLMTAMWSLYGWKFDPDEPASPNFDQVPLLRAWNEGTIGKVDPQNVGELEATIRAFRAAVAELARRAPDRSDSARHGAALAEFMEQAVFAGQSVTVQER